MFGRFHDGRDAGELHRPCGSVLNDVCLNQLALTFEDGTADGAAADEAGAVPEYYRRSERWPAASLERMAQLKPRIDAWRAGVAAREPK